MAIAPVSAPPSAPYPAGRNVTGQKQASPADSFSSIAVTYEKTEVSVSYRLYSGDTAVAEAPEDKTGANPAVGGTAAGGAETAQLKQQIHAEIRAQVRDFLRSYFEENPEAVEQISRGEIPDYFNVDNTARRILNIYLPYYREGEDRAAFITRAKTIINQAYSDVENMVGSLPEIVKATRERIMEMLDRFEKGEDISGFMNAISE